MHIIIGILGILTAVYFFVIRARNGSNMAGELIDVAQDVRAAARRFGFRRQTNIHPVEAIEDPTLAIGAISTAFLEMDDLPTNEQRDAMNRALREELRLDADAAQEVAILGHWFVSECGGPVPAVTRLSKKLFRLQGADAFQPLLTILNATLSAGSDGLNAKQTDALDEVKRAFRIK